MDAKFSVGELVHHKLFDYRGVVIDVDAEMMLSDEWYEAVARTRPPKDRPWYHVLVHDALHPTYVAERNLERDTSGEPIRHPLIDDYFSDFSGRRYVATERTN